MKLIFIIYFNSTDPKYYHSKYNQGKRSLMSYFTFFFSHTKSLKSGVYVTLTEHLESNQPHLTCSEAACGSWLPY